MLLLLLCSMYMAMYIKFTICDDHVPTDSRLRLVGGSLYNEGRVEVNYNDEWGTVCDNGWSSADAGVVCRQLEFESSGIVYYSAAAYFGQGSGPIWLDGVTCIGNELGLVECAHLGVNLLEVAAILKMQVLYVMELRVCTYVHFMYILLAIFENLLTSF